MSLGKLTSLSEVISRRKSVEIPVQKANRQQGDQDYVLVDDSEQDNDHQNQDGLLSPSDHSRSPAAVSVALRAPSEKSGEDKSEASELQFDPKNWAAFKARQDKAEDDSIDTARTDYSGLDVSSMPEVVDSPDDLQQALDQANQQHQWAMEAVMRGWEAEKADLLGKLERVIEARDTLEEELKHSEHSFAGMLEGILDQKLEHMMHVLQEGSFSRSASGSPRDSNMSSQSTFINAQQVAADLGSMLDSMRAQQAAVEDRVTSMRSAVLQLVPDCESTADTARSATSAPKASSGLNLVSVLRAKVGRPAAGAGRFIGSKLVVLRYKVPEMATASAQRTGSLARASVGFVKVRVLHAAQFCRQKAQEDRQVIQACACLLAGAVLTAMLARGKPKTALPEIHAEPLPTEEVAPEVDVLDVQPDKDPVLDQSVEIIVNKSGVFRRFGRAPDKTLVLAWPRISVEYN